MDLTAVLRSYIDKMLGEVRGMKVLLLDKDTTKIVSTVYSQSDILRHEVFLVESLFKEAKDQLFHLKASKARGCSLLPLCCPSSTLQ